jgi:hypothetical protein
MILALAAVLNPVGLDFIRGAFFTDEQLTSDIARPIVWIAIAVAIGLGLIEWTVRALLRRRRAHNNNDRIGTTDG